MHINVVQFGSVPYALGLDIQRDLVAARKQGTIADTLLLLEHKPVITLGRNAKRHHVIASDELLARRGVELFECDRGGDVTFHGPGQLVGYPIFDLFSYEPRIGAVDFVRKIEEVMIRTCADFTVGCHRVPGLTGVWTLPPREAKVGAIGVHISRGVTSHGFALNVNTDLEYFRLIVPCGIPEKPVTSLAQELGAQQPLEQVAAAAARHCGQVFQRQVLWVETIDALFGRAVGVPVQQPELPGRKSDGARFA
jgi:lipoyl(octanoyl) transferase